MFLTDEIGGQAYRLGEIPLRKPVITVRELIGARVDLEIEANRDREAAVRARSMPGLSGREVRLNGLEKAMRPSMFLACGEGSSPDRDRMIQAAEEGFVSGRFFLLLDDRQAEHLDDTLHLDTTGEATFLLLTPLQGG